MSTPPSSVRSQGLDVETRDRILDAPDAILDDNELMRALIAAQDAASGPGNVVDLRGAALSRLEDRLTRLEDTHRMVVAAAYENLASTNQIHRAILRMLEPIAFEPFLRDLGGEVADILRVDFIRLILESPDENAAQAVGALGDVLAMAPRGFVDKYLGLTRGAEARTVVLRQTHPKSGTVYGDRLDWIGSEAAIRLDLGPGRLPGMLVLGAEDPHLFSPSQGTDLLGFFGATFERAMRRWLA
ncbi:MAG: DUF484 family protein [Shimia sp.]